MTTLLAAGIGPIGPIEGLIILAVIVLIFGVGKLGDVGAGLGKSIREFRKAAREPDEPDDEAPRVASAQASAVEGRHCTNCGTQLRGDEKFCAQCGAPTAAAVN